MRHIFEEMEQYFMRTNSDSYSKCRSKTANAGCSEYQDSVDEFISRHSVKNGVICTDNIQKQQRDLHLNNINVNKNDSQSNSKINDIDTEIFVSKIIKYNSRLDKVIVKLMKSLKTEREQSDLKRIIKILQEKHKHNVMCLAKDSYKKLLKSEESFVENRELLLKPSTDLSCLMDHRYVQSENIIGHIKEIKRQNTYRTNDIYCPRSSCTNTINLHRDDGQTNLYSSMNSMTLRKLNSENLTLYPTIRVPFEKKYSIPKYSLAKEDLKPPERDRRINRNLSLRKPLARQIERLDKVKKKSLTNTSLKVETKIDDLVKNINLLIEEIQRQKSYKIDKKTETINEDKDNSNNVENYLKKHIVNVAQNRDVSVNTDVSIVCARLPRTESRFDMAKLRDKFRSRIIGTNSRTKMNTQAQAVKRTSSIGILATVATSDKSVDANRPIVIRVKNTPETTMNEENSLSSNEENMTTLVKGTNTDPLGVIALLTVSAETIKQLMSNVPSINYYSYLPFFQNSNYLDKRELQFVCDICGAAFSKASALNEHIKSHDLGFARNCGVCQHVLNSEQVRDSELFKCRYCGQRFTRAYCCELHQQSCARRYGLQDSASSFFQLA